MIDDAISGDRKPPAAVRLDELPLLDMRVGLHGSPRHVEVGGSVCFGMIITMGIYISR